MAARDWIDPTRLYNPGKPAGRLMYFWGSAIYPLLAFIVAAFCAASVEAALGYYNESPLLDLISTPLTLAFFLGIVLITIRRLRSLGKSGWYILWSFVPLANLVFGLWLLFAPGTILVPGIAPSSATNHSISQASGPPAPTAGPSSEQPYAISRRYCPACGSSVIPGAQYCMSCGIQLPKSPNPLTDG